MRPTRRAAFLDRDGVLNERPAPHTYVQSVGDLRLLPGVPDAVARLRFLGFVPVVVSNQRGIARGLVTWEALHEIEQAIQKYLTASGTSIEAFYYCPHDLDDGCDCRKPLPGLLHRAAREHGLDLTASVLVGDEESDVTAGKRVGCFTVRLGPAAVATAADARADGLSAAVDLITNEQTSDG